MDTSFTTYLPYINSTILCTLGHDFNITPFGPVLKYRFTLNDVLIEGHIEAEHAPHQPLYELLPQLRDSIAAKLANLLVLQLHKVVLVIQLAILVEILLLIQVVLFCR